MGKFVNLIGRFILDYNIGWVLVALFCGILIGAYFAESIILDKQDFCCASCSGSLEICKVELKEARKDFYVRECSLDIQPAGFYLSQSGKICDILQNNCLEAIGEGYDCQWLEGAKTCSCNLQT